MTASVREIDAPTLKGWLDRGECRLIDVREPGEHAREHIAAARLVPLDSLEPGALANGTPLRIVLHCASGARSARGAQKLAAAGLDVVHLAGGLPAWRAAGLPVIENLRAPLPIMRQVQIIAGSLVLTGAALGYFFHPGFYGLSAAVGAGLLFAGVTGHCGMATVLSYLPYNKV